MSTSMQTFPAQCVHQFVQNNTYATNAASTPVATSSSATLTSPSVPTLPVLLSGSLQSSLASAQLQPSRISLRKRHRETSVSASNSSDASHLKEDMPAALLVEIPSNDSTRTAACSRTLCCQSFTIAPFDAPTAAASDSSVQASSSPPSKQTLTLYWYPHRVEQQHFDMPQSDVERELRDRLSHVDNELHQLQQKKQRVDHHIKVLHDYNEIKDVVQALMGKCAEMEGATTKDMYEKFSLNLDD